MEGNQAVQAKEQRMVPGLYEERFEHDNCGIGAVVNIKGIKTHKTVDNALKICGEPGASGPARMPRERTGDGVGILLPISHKFFKKAAAEAGIELGEERDYGVGMFFLPQDVLRRDTRPGRCLRSLFPRKGWSFWAGERCLRPPACWASGRRTASPV